jgi:hypothetical protein
MNKISKSSDRHTFQKETYIKRKEEEGGEIDQSYLELFDQYINQHQHKFDDPASRKNNMEYDLLTTDWILEKVRVSEDYAQNLYAAMCNNEFTKRDLWPILKEEKWSCSWRYAGGIIADMRQEGDYINWYCSGIRGGMGYDEELKDDLVPEGKISKEIELDLNKLGWIPAPGGDWENFK